MSALLSPAVGLLFPILLITNHRLLWTACLRFTPSSCALQPAQGLRACPCALPARDRVWQPSFVCQTRARADCTTSRRWALSVVALFGPPWFPTCTPPLVARSILLRASVSEVSPFLAAVALGPCAGGQSALLDRVTRWFDRLLCVMWSHLLLTMLVLIWHWHTGVVSTGVGSSFHVLRVATVCTLCSLRPPRAARVGVTCALSLCNVVLTGPDLKCFRSCSRKGSRPNSQYVAVF